MLAARCDEHLPTGLEELLYTAPCIGDQTRSRASRLEDAGRRREAIACHAVPIDIEGCSTRAEKSVVVAGADMAYANYICRRNLVVPARAAEQKQSIGQQGCWFEEK